MIKIDTYVKIVMTVIAICLIKIAFFVPTNYSYAQFPFLGASDKPVDVNIKLIDDNEFVLLKNGDLHIGGKKGPRIIENGAFVVRLKKD